MVTQRRPPLPHRPRLEARHRPPTCGPRDRRPHLTGQQQAARHRALRRPRAGPRTRDYRRGYLCGMIRGDGDLTVPTLYGSQTRRPDATHRFRVALVDHQGLSRTEEYLRLAPASRPGSGSPFQKVTATNQTGGRDQRPHLSGGAHEQVNHRVDGGPADSGGRVSWPASSTPRAPQPRLLRFSNSDPDILAFTTSCRRRIRFQLRGRDGAPTEPLSLHSDPRRADPASAFFLSRIRRLPESARSTAPPSSQLAICRFAVESLGFDRPLYDMTTGTGDFVANGVVSHNCFARPTHDYLDFDVGADFETDRGQDQRLWSCGPNSPIDVARRADRMGTNTDPTSAPRGEVPAHPRRARSPSPKRSNPFSILTKSPLVTRDLAT